MVAAVGPDSQSDPRGFEQAVRRGAAVAAGLGEGLLTRLSEPKTASQIAAEELAGP